VAGAQRQRWPRPTERRCRRTPIAQGASLRGRRHPAPATQSIAHNRWRSACNPAVGPAPALSMPAAWRTPRSAPAAPGCWPEEVDHQIPPVATCGLSRRKTSARPAGPQASGSIHGALGRPHPDPHPDGAIGEQVTPPGRVGSTLATRPDQSARTHNRVAWADSLSLTGAEHRELLATNPQASQQDHGGGGVLSGLAPLQVNSQIGGPAAAVSLLQMGLTGQQLQEPVPDCSHSRWAVPGRNGLLSRHEASAEHSPLAHLTATKASTQQAPRARSGSTSRGAGGVETPYGPGRSAGRRLKLGVSRTRSSRL